MVEKGWHMQSSESVAAIMPALAAAQAKIPNIEKGKENTHFRSRYADIADGLSVIRPVLAEHGLVVTQATEFQPDTGLFVLHTRIYHTSGEWIGSTYPLPTSGKAQEMGSAITYARRYALFALVGTAATDEDTDGNDAAQANMKPKEKAAESVPSVEMLDAARSAATNGVEAFRAYWGTLTKPQRAMFSKTVIADLQKIAQASDEAA
jgi:ERF superfamily